MLCEVAAYTALALVTIAGCGFGDGSESWRMGVYFRDLLHGCRKEIPRIIPIRLFMQSLSCSSIIARGFPCSGAEIPALKLQTFSSADHLITSPLAATNYPTS